MIIYLEAVSRFNYFDDDDGGDDIFPSFPPPLTLTLTLNPFYSLCSPDALYFISPSLKGKSKAGPSSVLDGRKSSLDMGPHHSYSDPPPPTINRSRGGVDQLVSMDNSGGDGDGGGVMVEMLKSLERSLQEAEERRGEELKTLMKRQERLEKMIR